MTDLECDYYGCSLSEVAARAGGNRFPLRPPREHRESLAAGAGGEQTDIRRFEEIGTHPAANHNAIAEALAFHQAIGVERKAAACATERSWAKRVDKLPGVKILNSREPNQAWGLFNVSLGTVDAQGHHDFLWTKCASSPPRSKRDATRDCITPNVYTTLNRRSRAR
jgi:hypothetical protein